MLPNIVVSVQTITPNIEEPACPNIPVNITSDHLNELPVNLVPTDSMLTFVNQELGEDDVSTGPTAASTVSDSIPAIVMMTCTPSQEWPIPVATDTPPSFDVVIKDAAAAAAETTNSSLAVSMPHVRMSLKYLIICSRIVV